MWLQRKIARVSLTALLLITAGCGGFMYHRVQPGETLYSISWRYNLDYREVAGWNKLDSPYTIHSGQLLRIMPPADSEQEKSPASSPQPAPVVAESAAALPPPRTHTVMASTPIQWQWPTRGDIKQMFSEADISRKGIDIGGRLGQPVQAAAAGRVVYAGSGLLNYGKLIILKHDDNYLSAYAYNRALLVHEGDTVAGGQHIADMGSKTKGDPLLHFEIRYDGRPINPLKYLPPLRQ